MMVWIWIDQIAFKHIHCTIIIIYPLHMKDCYHIIHKHSIILHRWYDCHHCICHFTKLPKTISQGSTPCCAQRCRCHVKWSSRFRWDRRSALGGSAWTGSALWPWEPDRSVEHRTAMCRTEKAEGGGDGGDSIQILMTVFMPTYISLLFLFCSDLSIC